MSIINPQLKEYIIMNSESHQFLYGQNGKERASFLENIALQHPVVANQDEPMAIYIDDPGLGGLGSTEKDLKLSHDTSTIFHYRYYDFLILKNLIERVSTIINDLNDEKIANFIKKANGLGTMRSEYMHTVEDFKKRLEEMLEIYRYEWRLYIKTGEIGEFRKEESLFIDLLEEFLKEIKTLLNNNSYFNIIIDEQKPLSVYSKVAINKHISRRFHNVVSMKVACLPGNWTIWTYDTQYIRFRNDFDEVDLDGSNEEYVNKLTLEPKTSQE